MGNGHRFRSFDCVRSVADWSATWFTQLFFQNIEPRQGQLDRSSVRLQLEQLRDQAQTTHTDRTLAAAPGCIMAPRGGGRGRGGGGGDDNTEAFKEGTRAEEEGFDNTEDTKLGKATAKGRGGGGLIGPVMYDYGGFGGGTWDDSSDDDKAEDIPAWGGATDGELASAADLAIGASSGRMKCGVSDDDGALPAASAKKRATDDDDYYGSYYDNAGLAADFREGGGLPDGLSYTSGAEPTLLADEFLLPAEPSRAPCTNLPPPEQDGSYSLQMPADETAHLSMNLGYEQGITSWSVEDDGKLHTFTLVLAIRLENLPTTNLPLFTGGPASSAEGKNALEAVQIFKNGGVGALGQCGTAETAIKPGD
ncbi:hypothetical protein T492DRAFT_838988 [Pavlovales sp. CCMP2436]|nr:hypothetical protein T492DRAFT_838988 [Pavlovales sp. CCMP2436]